jgi:hypothetical protein
MVQVNFWRALKVILYCLEDVFSWLKGRCAHFGDHCAGRQHGGVGKAYRGRKDQADP